MKTTKIPKNKVRPSLARVLLLCQATLFLLLLIFVVVSMILLNNATLAQFQQEQRDIIYDRVSSVDSALQSAEQQIWDFFVDVTARRELYSANSGDQYFGKYATYQDIRDICSENSGIGFVFAAKQGGFLVSASSGSSYNNVLLREYVDDLLEMDFSEISTFEWNIVYLDDDAYFLYAYYYPSRAVYVGNIVLASDCIEPLELETGTDGVFHVTARSGVEYNYEPKQTTVIGRNTGYQYKYILAEDLTLEGYIAHITGAQLVSSALWIMLCLGIICFCGLIMQSYIVYHLYAKPITQLSEELENVGRDLHQVAISGDAATAELFSLKNSIRYLLAEVIARRLDAYEHKLQEQETQLFMLRSQIRPHFYLNAITTVNSMTYQNREEDIRKFLDALSVHMRYMMRTDESRITLGEEIKHIKAYIAMQEIRYPDKIIHYIDIPEEIEDIVIPHLIIYTIVENVFKYSLGVEDTLLILIQGQTTPEGFKVIIEDNGTGYSAEVLEMYNNMPADGISQSQKPHIGLRNVKRTLELKYGRDDLMVLRNNDSHGAVTELFFPVDMK